MKGLLSTGLTPSSSTKFSFLYLTELSLSVCPTVVRVESSLTMNQFEAATVMEMPVVKIQLLWWG